MRPNLFILGAAKCGTTSLHRLLARFEQVHVSTPKEPTFFSSQFQIVKNPIRYFRLFDSPKRYRCDASHAYLTSPETPAVLHGLFPDARFIITLRRPEERAHSLYRHMRMHYHADGQPLEPIETFIDALKAENSRRLDAEFRRSCRQYVWNFLYATSSRFDVQIRRYLNLYERNRFLFVTLAEMKCDSAGVVRKIGDFLELDLPRDLTMPTENVGSGGVAPCAASEQYLKAELAGVTVRVERLIGHPLTWDM